VKLENSTPIIELGPNLLVSLQGDLDDRAVLQLESDITTAVASRGAKGVLLELSGLTIIDSFIARVIARLAGMIRLLGAEAVVVGIQPAVAITLLELGIGMQHLTTALNAADGVALLNQIRE
jgi:rsbT antagonist protein RsbS